METTDDLLENVPMDKIEQLKALGKDNSVWRLTTSTAKTLASQLADDDPPVIVLPMRDVWISGNRFRGMRPTVCLSNRQLLAVSHPGLLGRAVSENVDRTSIVGVSALTDRTFEINLADGGKIKLRGMIGQRKVDQMTERLYSEIRSGGRHSAG